MFRLSLAAILLLRELAQVLELELLGYYSCDPNFPTYYELRSGFESRSEMMMEFHCQYLVLWEYFAHYCVSVAADLLVASQDLREERERYYHLSFDFSGVNRQAPALEVFGVQEAKIMVRALEVLQTPRLYLRRNLKQE